MREYRLIRLFAIVLAGSVMIVMAQDWLAGIAHFGWRSPDRVLRNTLTNVQKIRFVNRSNGLSIEFSDPARVTEVISQLRSMGRPKRCDDLWSYNLEFQLHNGEIVILHIGDMVTYDGFSFHYPKGFAQVLATLKSAVNVPKRPATVAQPQEQQ